MAKVNLYFLEKFNNYFNRKVIKYSSLNDYIQRQGLGVESLLSVSFNPNDGINSEQIINWNNEWIPDYMIVAGTQNVILQRWFIKECRRTRQGQFVCTLKRDTVADYYDQVIKAPCFIEKATLEDNDPFILNSEQMIFNQIKKSEELLKDKTNCAWLVAYISKNNRSDIKGTVPGISDKLTTINIGTNIENWELYNYTNLNENTQKLRYFGNNSEKLGIELNSFVYSPLSVGGANYFYTLYVNKNNILKYETRYINTPFKIRPNTTEGGIEAYREEVRQLLFDLSSPSMENETFIDNIYQAIGDDRELIFKMLELNDKYIKDSSGRIFLVHVNGLDTNDLNLNPVSVTSSGVGATLFYNVNNMFFNGSIPRDNRIEGSIDNSVIKVVGNFKNIFIYLQEVLQNEVQYDTSGTDIISTNDEVFDILAIPYGEEVNIGYTDGLDTEIVFSMNKELSLRIITAIANQHQTNVFDIQLLPFCPLTNIEIGGVPIAPRPPYYPGGSIPFLQIDKSYFQSASFKFDNLSFVYDESDENEKRKGIIFYVPNAIFSFTIDKIIKLSDELKIENECNFYRLNSPNYNGMFEFNLAKNGEVNQFFVDCHYRPYNPYIHIAPQFGKLYGTNYGDARGLICAGDFSLSTINDQWKQYQIQNKNYLNIFDRQIQNIEIQNKYQRISDIFGAIGGVGQGTASGVIGGAMATGNPAGAIIGGIAGFGSSLAGGIADVSINERLRQEQLDYTKDLFGYNLGNIRALPNTINKLSSFNPNNKIFPVLEYYSCTDEEKEALRYKLLYNGMTVMRIGKIEDYIKSSISYIKGQIIRMEGESGISEDSHLLGDIFAEINQGVYI